jgi:putative ATP-dependent endonuclease of OLD family
MTTLSAATPRLDSLRIRNYRSIGDWLELELPKGAPLVLVGENNAGKSNIMRALSLLLGDYWPGNYSPEDHEFFGRNPLGVDIQIQLETSGIPCPRGCDSEIDKIIWSYSQDADRQCEFAFEATGCSHTYMNNEVRGSLTCIGVGVNRNLSYQLSYASKWTALSKLMHRFHAHLVEDDQRVDKLKTFYSSLVETFYEVPEFKSFADTLTAATQDFGGNLPYGLDIDFSAYDASNFFRSLRVYPHLDGEARTYEELGTGQEQILAMAFSYSYAQAFGGSGLILTIEEPEAHLHPLAQEWIAERLQALAKSGVQVIVTTHSPYFVDLTTPGAVALVRKPGETGATTVTQIAPEVLRGRVVELGAPSATVTTTNIGPFYENSATKAIKAALFARVCVVVEGSTEQMSLPVLLKRVGLDVVKKGIAIVSVEGITNLAKWIRYFRIFEIPVYAIFDTDSQKTGHSANEARLARQDIFSALSLKIEEWTDVTTGPVGVTDTFAVMDPDFEGALRASFPSSYEELASRARDMLGDSKPLVARRVAGQLPEASPSPGAQAQPWQSIRTLAERLESLVPVMAHPAATSAPIGTSETNG